MRIRLLVSMLMAIFALGLAPHPINALEDTDICLSFDWSREAYYPGDYGNVTIMLESKSSNTLVFKKVRLAFIGGYYYYRIFQLDLSTNPIMIQPRGSCVFPSLKFYLHSRDPKGPLEYRVFLELEENSTLGWVPTTWSSPQYTMIIHDLDEKVYYNLTSFVEERLAQARAANFSDLYAKHLLQQCVEEKNFATQLSLEARWSGAIEHLQEASRLLEQAFSYETQYWKGQASTVLSSLILRLNQTSLQSYEAETLLLQASSMAEEAKRAYDCENFKDATLLATSALNMLERAVEAERVDQNRRRYLTVITFSGLAVAIAVSTVFALTKYRKSLGRVVAT